MSMSGESAEVVVRYSVVFSGIRKMSARKYQDSASWFEIYE
jgi:hypothetical protein